MEIPENSWDYFQQKAFRWKKFHYMYLLHKKSVLNRSFRKTYEIIIWLFSWLSLKIINYSCSKSSNRIMFWWSYCCCCFCCCCCCCCIRLEDNWVPYYNNRDGGFMSLPIYILQLLTKYLRLFLSFSIVFVQQKWNGATLLLPEVEYSSRLTSWQKT